MKTSKKTKTNKETLLRDNGIELHPNVKTVGTVYIEDHSALVKPKGQRVTVDNPDLSRSINNYGMCTAPTVAKDGNKYIVIDGWTRVEHCMKTNTPLLCVIIESEHPIEDIMVALNTTMFNWKPKDFLHFGISFHNNPDYILLDKIWRETELSLVALYEIFSFDVVNFNKRKTSFERGIWEMTTKNLGLKTIEYANVLKYNFPREFKFADNANFLRGFAICVKKRAFDFDHLLAQSNRYKARVHNGDVPTEHARMINEIYNLNTHEDKQAYLA
jgi:hypothetical protein